MTRAEALAEARKRWGPETYLKVYRTNLSPPGHKCFIWRVVSVKVKGVRGPGYRSHESAGSGPSWEAAFADASARERAK